MDVEASPLGLDEPGVLEYAEMLRDGPGRNAQQIRERPDAQSAPREKLHDIQPALHGKRPQYPRPLLLLMGCNHAF